MNQFFVLFAAFTRSSITGTSVSTPTVVASAAGESVENLGYWLYDTFGYEPGKKVYDEGTARKIGDIADVQLQNEIAARPSQLGQDIAKAGDSIATMLSYKLLTGPISTFAGSIASEAAFGKGLAAGVNNGLSLDKAAKEVAKVAAEKGSHVANNIFTGGMAMGSFGDKYIESRNAGLDKVESSARALVAGVASYVAESLGGIGGGKSPLNAIEEEAKKKWVTAILYEALEEGGEEFAEYTMNYLADGVIDLVARGKWEQNWDWNELLESAKIAFITGGLFGVSNQLMTKAFSGNAKIDEKLQDAKKEVLEDMKVTFEAEKDPAVRATVNAQLDNIIPDSEIAAAIENNNAQNGAQSPVESTLPLVENVQTETQKAKDTATEQRTEKQTRQEEMLDQLDVRAAEKKAPEKRTSSAQKTIETVKNSDLTIEQKLQRIRNLYNGSEGAEKEAYKQAYTELFNEKKAAQEAAARQESETPAQPKQETPQQAQKPAEVKSEAGTKAPQKAPQQGAARKADRDTVKRAYKDFSNTSMKQSRFEALYNEAYNAESFEAFMKKHPSFGEKLKGAMQKAFENGHRAEIKAENSALFNDGLIMDEGDRYMLKSRKDIDSLIERYKKAAEDGVVPIETDSENYYDQFRELSAEESQKYSEAAAKLKKYRDEHFAADKKSVSTEKKPANTEEKTASTESSTDKKKKRIESVIRNLEMLKQKLENGDMAKLEKKNPDKYSEIMFKFEQQTADKNGSDYLGSAEDVSVLIDKYKTDLEMLEAENGAQTENVGAQKGSVDNSQKFGYNRNSQYATVAPYYNTEVTAENKQQVKEAVNRVFTDNAKNTAKILGIKLKGETSNMGGFTFSEGEAAGQQVHEISYSFEFENATPEQAQLFASLMAENGYEQQEAAIQKRYVDNIDDGNAYEYTIRYRNMDEFAVAKALEKAGITDYTIDTTNGIIQILEFDIEKNTEIRNSIDTLLNNEEGSFYGTNYNPIQSEYLDETSRAGLYRSWLEKGEQDGERRNYISEALRKVEERIAENERVKTENKAKADAESSGFFNAQNSENAAKTQQNEYSPEYQNGAKHPETVGAMESDPMNITRAANESKVQPEKASTKNPFNDYDRYQSETNLTKADRNALERVVKNPVKGERTVWQETVDSVIDGDTYFEKDGKYYVKNEEGKTHRVAQSVFLFAEYLGKKGVRYTLNQTAEVPKEIGGRSVSKSVATALASRIGTNEFVEKIAANMEARDNRNAGLTYFKKKHSEVINWAKNYIEANGAEKAYAEFERAADGKTKYDAEHNVLGLMMCEMLSDINTSEANDLCTRIYAMIAANQTNAGQVSESMKMLKTLDRTNFTAFYEQLTQTLNQKHEKQLDGKKIILDDKLLKNAKESIGTENEARATLDLNRDIANQIPASGWDKINAVRYFCMLSSFRTDAKNMIANDVQFVMVVQKNLWLSAAERIYKKKHPEYMLTTSGFKTDISKAKFAGEVFGKENTGGNKYENKENWVKANRTNTFRGNGKLNKINIPGRILDFMANTKTKMLSAEDAAAKKALFVNRFVQVMEANHWTVEFLSDKSNPEAIKAYEKATSIAMEEALKGTFNDQSAMVQLLTQWKNIDTKNSDTTFAAGKVAVATFIETMFPFKNVPFNIAGSAIRYSPLGLFAGVCDLKKIKNGNLDARVALENISKGMTGTTVSLGGTLLAMLGMLTLGRDEDEDKPIEEKKDTTMYLKIPDKKTAICILRLIG